MESYLRQYMFKIKTSSPVFIGSGETVGKKEYIYERNANKILFLDMSKLYDGLRKERLLPAFEDYMLKDDKDLFFFFKDNHVKPAVYHKWVKNAEVMGDRGLIQKKTKNIQTFVKDPYGNPYIPGSSLKGMFRTIFQNDFYLKHPEKAKHRSNQIKRAEKNRKNLYLDHEDKQLAVDAFHKKFFQDGKLEDQVNDLMRGFIVSDSQPLSLDDLCVCQKVDLPLEGEYKPMPMLRECLKPGVEIAFLVTIDPTFCKFTINTILDAIRTYYEAYKENFMNKFKRAPRVHGNSTTMFLGGGAGYVSKTSSYAIMPGMEGVEQVGKILNNTLSAKAQRQHNHLRDSQKGVSPHILKCTKYDDEYYQMGACYLTYAKRYK